MKSIFKFTFLILFSLLTVSLAIPEKENLLYNKIEVEAINATGLWNDYRSSSFSAGSGTKEDPYLISSSEELALFSYKLNNNQNRDFSFKLTRDIDLGAHNWVPIEGNFDGSFDGNGFAIINLTIINQDFAGFFFISHTVGNAIIKNIIFTNVNFINNDKTLRSISLFDSTVGNSILENVHVLSGNYVNNADNVETIAGMIAGGGENALVNNCSANVNITGSATYAIGGFLGLSWSKFTNCYCYGSITTEKSRFVGGFAGQLYSEGLMENCFSKTIINLKSMNHEATGGLVGHLGYLGSTVIDKAYYKGNYQKLYGATDSYTANSVYLNLNSLNDLPTDIWAVDDRINDGDPYLKDRYWENMKK